MKDLNIQAMSEARRLEVWLANLNPQRGTGVGKVRPVLIIQTDLFEGTLESTLICPITTRESKSEITKIRIEPGTESGLSEKSWLIMDQIRAIDNKRFIKKLGKLSGPYVERVDQSIKIILDLT